MWNYWHSGEEEHVCRLHVLRAYSFSQHLYMRLNITHIDTQRTHFAHRRFNTTNYMRSIEWLEEPWHCARLHCQWRRQRRRDDDSGGGIIQNKYWTITKTFRTERENYCANGKHTVNVGSRRQRRHTIAPEKVSATHIIHFIYYVYRPANHAIRLHREIVIRLFRQSAITEHTYVVRTHTWPRPRTACRAWSFGEYMYIPFKVIKTKRE